MTEENSTIDLRDWIVADAPNNSSCNLNFTDGGGYAESEPFGSMRCSAPFPQLEPYYFPVRESIPHSSPDVLPTPPRKPSLISLKSAFSFGSSFSNTSIVTAATLRDLNPDAINDIDARLLGNGGNSSSTSDVSQKHFITPSLSSFYSVSLTSDTDDSYSRINNTEETTLNESFEDVITETTFSGAFKSNIYDLEKVIFWRNFTSPALSQRPLSEVSASRSPYVKISAVSGPGSSSSRTDKAPQSYVTSLPSRLFTHNCPSNDSSMHTSHSGQSQSYSSTASAFLLRTRRLAPIPLTARNRFAAVFSANILQQRNAKKQKEEYKSIYLNSSNVYVNKSRKADGWKALSVNHTEEEDSISFATPYLEKIKFDDVVFGTERLEGRHVKTIWSTSKLDQSKLRDIWNDCDSCKTGSLDEDEFIKGMWKVDGELRRVSR